MEIKYLSFMLVRTVHTRKSIYTPLFLFLHLFLLPQVIFAKENAQNALNSPVGSHLARIGLGVATDGDSSVVDINPALLASIQKQYSLFGSTNFHTGLDMFEIGVLDNIFTPVAAVLKLRQTTHSTTDIDRFFRLGLAYHIPRTGLSLGLSTTYIQHQLHNWIKSQESGGSIGAGALYQIGFQTTPPLSIGFSILNIFDRYQKTSFNFGVAKGFLNELYTLHADASILTDYKHPRVAGGLDVQFREFFYLRGTVGWDFDENVLPVGGGVFFNGPRLKAYYSLATYQVNTKRLWHSIGLILAFV